MNAEEIKKSSIKEESTVQQDSFKYPGHQKRFQGLLQQGYDAVEAFRLVNDEKTKVKGVAAKRMYQNLKKKGHTREEALIVAGMFQNRRDVQSRKAFAAAEGGSANEILGLVPGGVGESSSGRSITVAVACEDYPLSSLTPQQAKQIKSALMKQVVEDKSSKLKPHFQSCTFERKKGYFLIQCSNGNSLEWLKQTVSLQYLWDDVVLKVVPERNLINADTHTLYSVRFPDSGQYKNEEILKFVQRQNVGLKTFKWNALARKHRLKPNSVIMTLAVDPESDREIEKRNYKLNYNAEQIVLVKLNNGSKSQSGYGNWQTSQRQSTPFGSTWDNDVKQEFIGSNFSYQNLSSAGNFQQNRVSNYVNSSNQISSFGNATGSFSENRVGHYIEQDSTWTTRKDFSFGNSSGNLQHNIVNPISNQQFSGNFPRNHAGDIKQEPFCSDLVNQHVSSGNSNGNFAPNHVGGSNVEDQPFWQELFGTDAVSFGNSNGTWNAPPANSSAGSNLFGVGNSFGNAGNSSFGNYSTGGGKNNPVGGGKWPNSRSNVWTSSLNDWYGRR